MKINISDNAINYFFFLIKIKKKFGIKLGVKNSGCSGLKYDIKYINNLNYNNYFIFNKKGLIIFIKKKNFIYLNNIKIDVAKNKFIKKFIFNNPNMKNKCNCGKSFSI
ncbi:iron-sulfur cluster assembly accessory protein [Enterobacteriaceae bacterium ET-AT1-13]|nr:iron-sulfur cluster assembly accessory protein [Enterobacteriaceae bacterium ET-AT1-13]WGS66362.1 iron-sulfur cluster assembly accessory protein [Enterobacteriaceae bacterium Cmel17]WMC17387.1 MAG: iron-sulfur cluster assembly accessory protein [Enterobacteriaceae bacterium Cmel21]WMC17593.1 MAG: iron-sulfur cluster assembly accessory protein [Enterobacteriaceae bacterium PSmelAO3-2]WMC17798.1 MAG: iron-sulfur cluster assembly accessory protein [Enterobacteriaceae bacterium PSmelAO3-1]WMC18